MLSLQQAARPAFRQQSHKHGSGASRAVAAARPRRMRQTVAVRAQRQEDGQTGIVESAAAMQSLGMPLLTVRIAERMCSREQSVNECACLCTWIVTHAAWRAPLQLQPQATSVAFILLADSASAAEATSQSQQLQQLQHAELYQLASSVRRDCPSACTSSLSRSDLRRSAPLRTTARRRDRPPPLVAPSTGRLLAQHGALRPFRDELRPGDGLHHPQTPL